jgi:signal transduction histidine kinase
MSATVLVFAPASSASAGWRRALERAGFSVHEAPSRNQWPADTAAALPALAVVSVVDKTDRDRIAALKRDRPESPVLAIVSAGSSVRAEALEAGADACLPHDAEPVEIVAAARALERRCLSAERERALLGQAHEASKVKDEFLAAVSQELRAPLNTIAGWAQILMGPMVDTPMMRRGLEAIERSAQSQKRLLSDLLDMSRSLTGKLHVEKQEILLGPVLDAAIDSIRPLVAAKQIELIYVPLQAPVRLVADASRLQQMFWNILSNAVKFTPLKGRIGVETAVSGTNVEVRVIDNGMGIAADFLPYVFERFREGDSPTTRPQAGLGLGLALVRHLVETHGGTVTADSAGEGRGSIFTVTLPLDVAGSAGPVVAAT